MNLLTFRINKDRIGDVSIKLQVNHDEAWTKALKYLLIDLKWMMAFATTSPEALSGNTLAPDHRV